MLTAKPFDFADKVVRFYPGFEPPSPESPSRPLRVKETLSSRLLYIPPVKPGDMLFAAARLKYALWLRWVYPPDSPRGAVFMSEKGQVVDKIPAAEYNFPYIHFD